MVIMTCADIENEIANGAILLDVRTPAEYNQVRLPNAQLLPLNELSCIGEHVEPGTKILVYCRTGARSGTAEHMLTKLGFDAKNIGGVVHYTQCLQY